MLQAICCSEAKGFMQIGRPSAEGDWHALLCLLLEQLWELPLLICAIINVQPGLVLEVQRLPECLHIYMQ